jgi:hypothetical protein
VEEDRGAALLGVVLIAGAQAGGRVGAGGGDGQGQQVHGPALAVTSSSAIPSATAACAVFTDAWSIVGGTAADVTPARGQQTAVFRRRLFAGLAAGCRSIDGLGRRQQCPGEHQALLGAADAFAVFSAQDGHRAAAAARKCLRCGHSDCRINVSWTVAW